MQSSSNIDNNNNDYLATLANPFQGAITGIPDDRQQPGILKTVRFNANLDLSTRGTANASGLLVFPFFGSRQGIRVYYNAGPNTPYRYAQTIESMDNVLDNFDSFRVVSGGLRVRSTTNSGGNLPLNGTLCAVCYTDLPNIEQLSYQNLLSFAKDSKSAIGPVAIQDGLVSLSGPSADKRYLAPDNSAYIPIDGSPRYDNLECVLANRWSGGGLSFASGLATRKFNLPQFIWGKFRVRMSFLVNFGAAVTKPYCQVRLQSPNAFDVTPIQRVTMTLTEGNQYQVWMDQIFATDQEFASIELSFSPTGQIPTIVTDGVGYVEALSLDMFSPNFSGPGVIIAFDAVSYESVITLDGILNVEAVPNYQLSRNVPAAYLNFENSVDIEVANLLFRYGGRTGVKQLYSWADYGNFINGASRGNLMSRDVATGHAASLGGVLSSIWSFAKPVLRRAAPPALRAAGQIAAGMTGMPEFQDVGNSLGKLAFRGFASSSSCSSPICIPSPVTARYTIASPRTEHPTEPLNFTPPLGYTLTRGDLMIPQLDQTMATMMADPGSVVKALTKMIPFLTLHDTHTIVEEGFTGIVAVKRGCGFMVGAWKARQGHGQKGRDLKLSSVDWFMPVTYPEALRPNVTRCVAVDGVDYNFWVVTNTASRGSYKANALIGHASSRSSGMEFSEPGDLTDTKDLDYSSTACDPNAILASRTGDIHKDVKYRALVQGDMSGAFKDISRWCAKELAGQGLEPGEWIFSKQRGVFLTAAGDPIISNVIVSTFPILWSSSGATYNYIDGVLYSTNNMGSHPSTMLLEDTPMGVYATEKEMYLYVTVMAPEAYAIDGASFEAAILAAGFLCPYGPLISGAMTPGEEITGLKSKVTAAAEAGVKLVMVQPDASEFAALSSRYNTPKDKDKICSYAMIFAPPYRAVAAVAVTSYTELISAMLLYSGSKDAAAFDPLGRKVEADEAREIQKKSAATTSALKQTVVMAGVPHTLDFGDPEVVSMVVDYVQMHTDVPKYRDGVEELIRVGAIQKVARYYAQLYSANIAASQKEERRKKAAAPAPVTRGGGNKVRARLADFA